MGVFWRVCFFWIVGVFLGRVGYVGNGKKRESSGNNSDTTVSPCPLATTPPSTFDFSFFCFYLKYTKKHSKKTPVRPLSGFEPIGSNPIRYYVKRRRC